MAACRAADIVYGAASVEWEYGALDHAIGTVAGDRVLLPVLRGALEAVRASGTRQPIPLLAFTDNFADSAGVRIHYVTAGNSDGPMVLMVHGLPDFWYGWRHLIALDQVDNSLLGRELAALQVS